MNRCVELCAVYRDCSVRSTPESLEPIISRANTAYNFPGEFDEEIQVKIEEIQARIVSDFVARNVELVRAADFGECPGPKGVLRRCQNPLK